MEEQGKSRAVTSYSSTAHLPTAMRWKDRVYPSDQNVWPGFDYPVKMSAVTN